MILRHFHSKNVGSEVLWAELCAESWPVSSRETDFSSIWLERASCIQHLPLASSPDFKTVGAPFSPARSGKYLRSARTINFWSLWWMCCCLLRLSNAALWLADTYHVTQQWLTCQPCNRSSCSCWCGEECIDQNGRNEGYIPHRWRRYAVPSEAS